MTAPEQAAGSCEEIADMLTTVASANGHLAAELDVIVGGGETVSQATIGRLERLLDRVRPTAAVRERLGQLDPEVLLDGVAVWTARRTPGLRRGGRSE